MSNGTKPMGQHILDELSELEVLIEETKRRFDSDVGAIGVRVAQLLSDVRQAREARRRSAPPPAQQEQRQPDTDPAPGDEPPVAWPCRHPDGDGYAVKLQDRAAGEQGMPVRIQAKSGKTGTAYLEAHVATDQYGETWTTDPIRWDD